MSLPSESTKPSGRLVDHLPLVLMSLGVVGVGLGLRTLLIIEKSLPLSWADFVGGMLDVGIGGLVLCLLFLVRQKVLRFLSWILGVIWICVNFASYEFVSTFDSIESLGHATYIKDPTFLIGSFTQVAHPVLMVLALSLFSVGVWLRVKKPLSSLQAWVIASVASLLFAGVGLMVPQIQGVEVWRQSHFVPANFLKPRSSTQTRVGNSPDKPLQVGEEVKALMKGDLSGNPRFPELTDPSTPPNILLVLIEGISGAYLPSVTQSQGFQLPSLSYMPKLDALAKNNISYTNIIHQQRQTNRGEYAILCGDYPKLDASVAKMSTFASGSKRVCMPELLKRAGYHTMYIQAAPLSFMFKDQFMKQAGFERMHGTELFDKSYHRNGWGVDDLAMYEKSAQVLEEVSKEQTKPWFATLLTVTTHHPYATPDDFKPFKPTTKPHQKALAYADDSVDKLLKDLRKRGVLKNTVVVIASDESAGVMYGRLPNPALRSLSHHWGFAVVITPDGKKATIQTPYMASDFGLTLSDLAGVKPADAEHLVGRSLLRDYPEPRTLHFANTYSKKQGLFHPNNTLTMCEIGTLNACQKYNHKPGKLFDLGSPSEDVSPEVVNLMRQVLLATTTDDVAALIPPEASKKGVVRPLLNLEQVVIPTAKEHQLIFGGQYLKLPPKTAVDLELEVGVEADGTVDFKHLVVAGGKFLPGPHLPILSGGDSFHVKTSLYFEEGTQSFRYHFAARKLTATNATLKIKKATMRLHGKPRSKRKFRTTLFKIQRSKTPEPQVYELAKSLHFHFRFKCAKRDEETGVLRINQCKPRYLMYGPFVKVAKGSKVDFEVTVQAASKDTKLKIDLASLGGKVIHAESPLTLVQSRQTHTFRVSAVIPSDLERFEARVIRDEDASVSSTYGLRILSAKARVTPPHLVAKP